MMNISEKICKTALCLVLCFGIGGFLAQSGIASAEEDYFETLQIGRFEEPMEVPDFSLPLVGGGSLRLSDYKGRVVLLNFWATWCPHCVKERADLQSLYEKYKDQGLAIIAVSIDRGGLDTVQKFVEERDLTFLNVHDKSSTTSSEYGVRGVPATIIIEPSGAALGGAFGPRDWESDEAGGLVEQILAEYKDALTL